jgi:hypothetical protein
MFWAGLVDIQACLAVTCVCLAKAVGAEREVLLHFAQNSVLQPHRFGTDKAYLGALLSSLCCQLHVHSCCTHVVAVAVCLGLAACEQPVCDGFFVNGVLQDRM